MSIQPKASHTKGASADPAPASGGASKLCTRKALPDTGLKGLHRESPYLTLPGSSNVFKRIRPETELETTNNDAPTFPGLILTNDDGRPIADPHTRDNLKYKEATRALRSLDHHDESSDLIERQANELSKVSPATLAKQLAETKRQYDFLKDRLAEAMTKQKYASHEGNHFEALKCRRPEIAKRIEHAAAELATKHSTDPADPHSPRSMDIQIRRAFQSMVATLQDGERF
jgi:hypothetical protein